MSDQVKPFDFNIPVEKLSPRTRKAMQEKGKLMYDTFDFEKGESIHPHEDELTSIVRAVNSGLKVTMLSPREREMYNEYVRNYHKRQN